MIKQEVDVMRNPGCDTEIGFNVSYQGESIVESALVRRFGTGVMVVEVLTKAGVETIAGGTAFGIPYVSFYNRFGLRSDPTDPTSLEFPGLKGWSIVGLGRYVKPGALRNHSNPHSFSITLVGPIE